jgi:hypothetical protein
LSHGVVLRIELELDQIASLGYNAVWGIYSLSGRASYCDDVDSLSKCAANAQGSSESE